MKTIIINGQELTEGQKMTLWAALQSFYVDLTTEGLGDDEVGKGICNGYLARIRELNHLILEE